MSKDIWHITNQNKDTTDVPEEENMVVLDGVMGYSCLWYGGATPEPIFWENVKKWCYLDDLLALETKNKDLSDKIGKLETELERTRKALDVAVDALKTVKRYLCEMPAPDSATVLRMACESATTVKKALEQITALEQKE